MCKISLSETSAIKSLDFEFFKMLQLFQKLQKSRHRLTACLAFAIILLHLQITCSPKISFIGTHSGTEKGITTRSQSDLFEIFPDILPLTSPTRHPRNKYLKMRKISEFVTKYLSSTMLKYSDHDAEKEVLQPYAIIHNTIQFNLSYVPVKYLDHDTQFFTITYKKKSQVRQSKTLKHIKDQSQPRLTSRRSTLNNTKKLPPFKYAVASHHHHPTSFASRLVMKMHQSKISEHCEFSSMDPQYELIHLATHNVKHESASLIGFVIYGLLLSCCSIIGLALLFKKLITDLKIILYYPMTIQAMVFRRGNQIKIQQSNLEYFSAYVPSVTRYYNDNYKKTFHLIS